MHLSVDLQLWVNEGHIEEPSREIHDRVEGVAAEDEVAEVAFDDCACAPAGEDAATASRLKAVRV